MGTKVGKDRPMIQVQHSKLTISYFVLAISLFLGYLTIPAFLEHRTFNKLNLELTNKMGAIDKYLNAKIKLFEKIAQDEQAFTLCSSQAPVSQNNDEFNSLLKKHLPDIAGYHNITVLTIKGDIVFSEGHASTLLGKNVTTSPLVTEDIGTFFQQATITQQPDVFLTKTKDAYCFFLYVPILKSMQPIGFIFAELSPNELFSIINHKYYSKNTEILLGEYTNKITIIPLNQQQRDALPDMIIYDSYLTKASQGDIDQNIIPGKNQQPMLSTWRYHPFLDMGLLINLPYRSITLCSYVLLALFLLFLSLGIISSYWHFRTIPHTNIQRYYIKFVDSIKEYYTFALLGIFLCGLLLFMASYKHLDDTKISNTHIKTSFQTRTLSQKLNTVLSEIKEASKLTAQKLQTSAMSEEELNTFITTLLQEHPDIFSVSIGFKPNSFDPAKKLFAPNWMRTNAGIDKTHVEDSYDYTISEHGNWYKSALKDKFLWESPYLSASLNKIIICYASVFYNPNDPLNQEPRGVIRISYKISQLNDFIENLGHKTAQRSIIIDKNGTLIYYPKTEHIASNTTIFTLANGSFKTVTQALHAHFSKIIPSFMWHKEEHLQESGWIVALAFDSDDINPVKKSAIFLMLIVLCTTFALFFTLLIFLQHWPTLNSSEQFFLIRARGYVSLVAIGIGFLWAFAYQQPWMPNSSTTVVRDRGTLNNFLEAMQQQTYAYNKPPIPIKTGLIIKKFDDSNLARTGLIATAWQIYDKEILKTITPGITIAKAQKVTVKKAFEREEDNRVVIGWDISAEIFQQTNYVLYPFNKKDLIINIRHTDEKNNVICIPDFKGYEISPQNPHPWIDTRINDLYDSFFSYPDSNGSASILQINKNLNLHIITRENILNSLIAYIIPLLISLFSIFALLWLEPNFRIAGFSALFFAVIFMHRALRGSLNLTSIAYLEYFFLITYITLWIVMAISSVAAAKKVPEEKSKYYFWPIQATVWLILAITLFFH